MNLTMHLATIPVVVMRYRHRCDVLLLVALVGLCTATALVGSRTTWAQAPTGEPLFVTGQSPVDGATGVALLPEVRVTFDRPIVPSGFLGLRLKAFNNSHLPGSRTLEDNGRA